MAKKTFSNLNPEIRPRFSNLLRWMVIDRLNGKRRKSPDTAPVKQQRPVGLTNRVESVTWLGHATNLLSLNGRWIITDPVFAAKLGGLIPRNVGVPLPADELPPIDLVVLSHNHRDHLDRTSIWEIEMYHEPVYVVPLEVDKILVEWGIDTDRILTMQWWSSIQVSGVDITCVPAQHWSRRSVRDLNTSLWAGFVMKSEQSTIYFAGDSGYFDQFAEIGRRLGSIDLALLPIGAYDPEWFMLPQHMNPAQAIQAMQDCGARKMIPIHWGTYKLSDEPLDEPPVLLERAAQEAGISLEAIQTLAVGQTLVM